MPRRNQTKFAISLVNNPSVDEDSHWAPNVSCRERRARNLAKKIGATNPNAMLFKYIDPNGFFHWPNLVRLNFRAKQRVPDNGGYHHGSMPKFWQAPALAPRPTILEQATAEVNKIKATRKQARVQEYYDASRR